MTPFPALAGLRIGCVKYLNSKPLIAAFPGPVLFDHPSRLARELAAGRMDAALVPIFEALRAGSYLAVDQVAIASHGPVYSVFLAYRGPLQALKTVALDPASLTSAHLVQVLLREGYGLAPRCFPLAEAGAGDARLLIGNQAIDFRRDSSSDYQFLDLGEEWTRQTHLPFVFALWLLRPEIEQPETVANDFRAIKEAGLPLIRQLAAAETEIGPALALKYLTEHIRFDLGDAEKAGIERFRELLIKYRFIGDTAAPLRFL